MVHIQISPFGGPIHDGRVGPVWSRGDYIQMVQSVQENGASGLWSFKFQAFSSSEGCDAMRIGWLDVPQQPTLKGEWRFDISEPSSDSDIPIQCPPRTETCLTAVSVLPVHRS